MDTEILIVGAGLCGLHAATRLQAAGRSVLVLEKSRGLGGRAATRRWNNRPVDHGAQFFTAKNPEFIEKRLTKDQILTNFLRQFEGPRAQLSGNSEITLDEFIDYYTDLSMSIPTDDYFVAMMESTWQCPEEENTKET